MRAATVVRFIGPVRVRVAVALVVALAALVGSAPAMATFSSKKAIWGPVTLNGKSEFPVYHTMGVDIFQDDLDWAAIAPTRPHDPTNPNDPAYQWPAELSYAIGQAKQYHMRVALEFADTPAWASGHTEPTYPPRRLSDLKAFLTAASRRYPSVHLWLIWGEPTRQATFAIVKPVPPNARRLTKAEARAPHRYAQMLNTAYGALKGVSSKNLIIGGDSYTTGDIPTGLWIKNLRLPDGQPPRMDMYGHNPFSFRAPNLRNPPSPDHEVDFSDLGRLSKMVDRYLAPRGHVLKLFLSEWCIPTAPGDIEFNYWVNPAVQAQWITDAWRIVNRSSFIYALGWIHVYDDPPPGPGSKSGLFSYNGVPKPGYYAWRNG